MALPRVQLIVVCCFAMIVIAMATTHSSSVTHANQRSAGAAAQMAAATQAPQVKFATALTYSLNGAPLSVAVADINRDGKLDVVTADGDEVSVLLGNGDGNLAPPNSFRSGGYGAISVKIGDVNGDGNLDLVVANKCADIDCSLSGTVGVLFGNGDGSFQPPLSYTSVGFLPVSVVIGDLNGDHYPDLVLASYCQSNNPCSNGQGPGGVIVLLGNGDGTFQPAVLYNSGGYFASSVAVRDVNGDGKLDLIVAHCCFANSGGKATVGVLLGNGDGTFQAAATYSAGGYNAHSVAIRDINGDGTLDIVVSNFCETTNCTGGNNGDVGILLGKGDGTFQSPVHYSSGGYYAWSVEIGDVNGDGRPDLVIANSDTHSVGVLLNILAFTTTTSVTSAPNPSLVNEAVTFTAATASSRPIPDGQVVTFYNGATKIGTGTMTGGTATLTTSFAIKKTYTIKAKYSGDAFHKASSGTMKQVVNN